MGTSYLADYFPEIDPVAASRFERLFDAYAYWNARINVISRKDMPNLCINHILHSLSLAKVIPFNRKETVVDIGTGGGFPGIPLAIMYPNVQFTLIDSTGKKIKVVDSIVNDLGLGNVETIHTRAETYNGRFNYVVSRAVCSFPGLVELSSARLLRDKTTLPHHGIYSLKGGDLQDEVDAWKEKVKIFEIGSFFNEEFFRTKCIVFLSTGSVLPG